MMQRTPSLSPQHSGTRVLPAIVLIWTFAATLARSVRAPNQFAEAHWLLDYRFGFMKRGLVGTICSAGANFVGTRMTESVILFLSAVISVSLWTFVLLLLFRILGRHGWRDEAVVACLVLVSSPFTVMSGHLVGYFASLLFLFALASVMLVRRDRHYAAAAVSILGLLTHESYALTGLPLVWVAAAMSRQRTSTTWREALVLVGAPVLVFITIPILQGLHTEPMILRTQLTQHLDGFGFLGDRSHLVALWQTTPAGEFLATYVRGLDDRVLAPAVLATVLPTLLTLLLFTHASFRILPFGAASTALLGAVCAPLAMHALAWDTARIWTYTLASATVVLWILSESRRARPASSLVLLVAVPTLVLNAFADVPLMDNEPDHFSNVTRLLLYLPAFGVMAAAVWKTSPKVRSSRPIAE
jgi:hypothetical protein